MKINGWVIKNISGGGYQGLTDSPYFVRSIQKARFFTNQEEAQSECLAGDPMGGNQIIPAIKLKGFIREVI